MVKSKVHKVVLAYSGGLDTSAILPWLKETYGYDVIAFAAELGQGDELVGIKKKALASGAVKCVVKDLRAEYDPTDATGFIRLFGLPMKVAASKDSKKTRNKRGGK